MKGELGTRIATALAEARAATGRAGLIGLRRFDPALFAGNPWGTETVLDRTRGALRYLGWAWQELPARRDVDRPGDLAGFPNLVETTHPGN